MGDFEDCNEIKTLFENGALIVDARDASEIEKYGDAVDGHINIPWTSFGEYQIRLKNYKEILGGLNRHLLVICMRGRRAGLLIEELEKCGYKNTHNCENPTRLWRAIPDASRTNTPNTISPYDSEEEIRSLIGDQACFIDVREPEEIESYKDAIKGHVNIPVGHFSQYSSRLRFHPELIGDRGFDSPIIVYCRKGRRAAMAKNFLDAIGFTNVHNGLNPEHIHAAAPAIQQVDVPNMMSPYADHGELRRLFAEGALVIDSREIDEIEEHRDAIEGHINIPWTSFGQFAARLDGDLIGACGRPLIVHCAQGRRAGLLINALEQCGYTRLFNGKNVAHIREAVPDIPLVARANRITPFLEEYEIEEHMSRGDVTLIDCREPGDIIADGSVDGHLNLPWSSFRSGWSKSDIEAVLGSDLCKPIFVFCSVGWRSGFMKKELESVYGFQNVFNVKNANRLSSACNSLQQTHTPNTMLIK